MPITSKVRKLVHAIKKPALRRKQSELAREFRSIKTTHVVNKLLKDKALDDYIKARQKGSKVGEQKSFQAKKDRFDRLAEKSHATERLRQEAFSDLLLARAKAKKPLTKLEQRAFELTRGVYKGNTVTFTSKSGNTYRGTFIGIGASFDMSSRKVVPAIRLIVDGREESLRVDKLELRNKS